MPFAQSSKKYEVIDIKNPLAQEQGLGEILSICKTELKWWRAVCGIGSLVFCLINFFFTLYAVSLQQTVPVLINVMPSGEASYLGEVHSGTSVQIPEAAVLFQLRKFITNLRSISTDRQVLYDNINECYDMITAGYAAVMTKKLRENNPFDLVGKTRRQIEIESALKITGSSYQLDWLETEFDNTGSQKKTKMRAILTVKIISPGAATIKKNPLGIYIENCEMTTL
ncbi:MAG: conjugal transfer protein TrbF [Termitinemataceae bacterium]|jgi:type IV secretion system protein VirB5|nr:MAG: conjugal transfer protein TrbF [Termitinemataceae bacterium]